MPQVQVDRSELLQAFKSIKRLTRAGEKAEAVLSFEGGALSIALPGMEVGAAATGDLAGRVRVPAQFIQMLAKMPPTGDPVVFTVEGDRLRVGSSTTPCTWEEDAGARIRLPLNPPFTTVLGVAYHYTPDDIEKAGLKEAVAAAEKRRDALIGQALGALGEFGVTRAELRTLVDDKMKRAPKP